jgi:hypothetical protein
VFFRPLHTLLKVVAYHEASANENRAHLCMLYQLRNGLDSAFFSHFVGVNKQRHTLVVVNAQLLQRAEE